jgi:hypothetical protein
VRENQKSEARNPKQIQITEIQNSKRKNGGASPTLQELKELRYELREINYDRSEQKR